MDRQPSRIHPSVRPAEGHIVTFRDGPRLVPDYLAEFATADSYPLWTFQEWVEQVVNKRIETRFVGQALGLLRLGHFAR